MRGTLLHGGAHTSGGNALPLSALERGSTSTHGPGRPIELARGVEMARNVQVEVFSVRSAVMVCWWRWADLAIGQGRAR